MKQRERWCVVRRDSIKQNLFSLLLLLLFSPPVEVVFRS